MPVLPSYRNQSIDLLCKSIDLFLYDGNTGIKWAKLKQNLEMILYTWVKQNSEKILTSAFLSSKYFLMVWTETMKSTFTSILTNLWFGQIWHYTVITKNIKKVEFLERGSFMFSPKSAIEQLEIKLSSIYVSYFA